MKSPAETVAQKIKIEQNDPIYNNSKSRFKEVKLPMKANQHYVIDLAKTGNETPALFLEDGTITSVDNHC